MYSINKNTKYFILGLTLFTLGKVSILLQTIVAILILPQLKSWENNKFLYLMFNEKELNLLTFFLFDLFIIVIGIIFIFYSLNKD